MQPNEKKIENFLCGTYLNFKAVLALPKMAGSSQTHYSISFTLISLGGTKGKMLENQCIVMAIFQHFSLIMLMHTIYTGRLDINLFYIIKCLKWSATPLRQWIILRGKHCRCSIAIMGVVDHLGQFHILCVKSHLLQFRCTVNDYR